MQKISDGLVLYHGSYCEVSVPDLKKCAKQKDLDKDFILRLRKIRLKNF